MTRRREVLIAGLLTFILFLLAYAPIVVNYMTVPDHFQYLGTETFALDFIGYLTIVREGFNGAWQGYFAHWFDPVQTPPGFTIQKLEYVIMGHVARVLSMNPLTMMLWARGVFALGLFGIVYWFLTKVFKQRLERLYAYGLTLFAGAITQLGLNYNFDIPIGLRLVGYVFQRFIITKHHRILANALLLPSIYLFSQAVGRKRFGRPLVYAVITMVLGSWLYPPGALFVIATIPVSIAIMLLNQKTRAQMKQRSGQIMLVSASYIAAAVILLPKTLAEVDAMLPTEEFALINLQPMEYVMTVGLVFFVALASIGHIVRSSNYLRMMLLSWLVVHPVAAFGTEAVLGKSAGRVFDGLYHIIFSVLAVIGLQALHKRFRNRWSLTKRTFFAVAGSLILLSSAVTYKDSLRPDCFCLTASGVLNAPTHTQMNAIRWIEEHTAFDDTVLTGHIMGSLVPAFSDAGVIVNWWMFLSDAQIPMRTMMQRFYGEDLTLEVAQAFIDEHSIDYVVYSFEERQTNGGKLTLDYPFLESAFVSGSIIVYRVID